MKGNWNKGRYSEGVSVPAAKLLRCLRLIKQLESRGMTLSQIETFLEVSERTAYRYVALFEEAGYLIDKDVNNKFFIAK